MTDKCFYIHLDFATGKKCRHKGTINQTSLNLAKAIKPPEELIQVNASKIIQRSAVMLAIRA